MFAPIRLPCRNDSHDVGLLPIAVAYDEETQARAEAQENKTLFLAGMVGVIDENGVLVQKGRGGLFERQAMQPDIRAALLWIPLEAQFQCHIYIVPTT